MLPGNKAKPIPKYCDCCYAIPLKRFGVLAALAVAFCGTSAQDDVFAQVKKAESERRTCRANLMTYANAAMAFRVQYRREDFTSDISDLEEFFNQTPICPAGGVYSMVGGVPEKSFTIHCSILKHDAGRVQPPGYSPRLNSDADNFNVATIWNTELPARDRCRASMVLISLAQIDYLLDNGKFTSDIKVLQEIKGEQTCPEQGTYS